MLLVDSYRGLGANYGRPLSSGDLTARLEIRKTYSLTARVLTFSILATSSLCRPPKQPERPGGS